jgi:hypothetical protein
VVSTLNGGFETRKPPERPIILVEGLLARHVAIPRRQRCIHQVQAQNRLARRKIALRGKLF